MFDDIIKNSKWSESHGAVGNHAGMGIFYYALPYSLRASSIVCLGYKYFRLFTFSRASKCIFRKQFRG